MFAHLQQVPEMGSKDASKSHWTRRFAKCAKQKKIKAERLFKVRPMPYSDYRAH
jgi:hypothetical protein